MKAFRICISFLFIVLTLNGQTGREFWFAAPDISSALGNGQPANLHITALYETTVRISRPADPSFIPFEFHLTDMENRMISLSSLLGSASYWENYPQSLASGGQNKGFLIESEPGEISVYFEMDHSPDNRDIIPLKGTNALGRDFVVSTQNLLNNTSAAVSPYSGFVVIATEDNTTITVDPNGNVMYYFPGPPPPFSFTLNRGQTFAFRAFSQDSLEHINGIGVTSDKDIAITVYDDGITNGCAYDLLADQIVPINYLGSEYLIQRGFLDSLEAVFVTATQAATDININGVYQATLANAGDVYQYKFQPSDTIIQLSSTKPAYVMHMSGIGCKVAGALLPSFDNCIGSNVVAFTRTYNVSDAFYIRLIGHNENNIANPYWNKASDNFYFIIDNDTTKIPKGYFNYSKDSSFVYLVDSSNIQAFVAGLITPGKQVQVYNPVARFHFGTLMGGPGNGVKYGYHSDYASTPLTAGLQGFSYVKDTIYCNLDPVHLIAHGGSEYLWTGISDPAHADLLSADTVRTPYFNPDTSGVFTFNVNITGSCGSNNVQLTLRCFEQPSSDFNLDIEDGCSPLTINVDNISNTTFTERMMWAIDAPNNIFATDSINQDTIPLNFDYTLPDNNSDSLQIYSVKLFSFSPGNYCVDTREKNINLKPAVYASFTQSDTSGCHPVKVSFSNTSTTGHDTLTYVWDFGNSVQSIAENPTVTYLNNSLSDTIFTVELVAETAMGCTDTARQEITVLPRVLSVFSVDTNYSCSPLSVELDPGGSIGSDSLFWYIDYFYADSVFETDLNAPLNLIHADTSISSGPDTLRINLITKSSYGCSDTSTFRELIVYPNINSEFIVSADTICDSILVSFNNLSSGYLPVYEWNFGDNSFMQDSSEVTHIKRYFNRSTNDTTYHVTLTATSENTCVDIFDTNIVVHPYVNADFGFEYDKNCTPLLTTITNTSIQVDNYFWDLGDGTTSASSAASFTHTYTNPLSDRDTTYYIKLIASNSQGCQDSLIRSIMLLPEVVADFSLAETGICSGDSAHFQNNSTGNNLTFIWSFGDAQNSTTSDLNFAKRFTNYTENDTNYSISLIARNAVGCTDTLINNLQVLAYINANFSLANADSCSPFNLRITNLSSSGANVFNWDFGPNGTDNIKNPTPPPFTNPPPSLTEDTVLIELAVAGFNDALHWSCSDTHRVPIVIYPELDADFNLDNTADCQPLQATFTNNTQPSLETTYAWYLNDVFYSSLQNPDDLNIHNYTDSDSSIRVWLYGNTKYGCRDTVWQDITVYSNVNAQFTVNKQGICTYDSVFIDRSSSEGGITQYAWDFDGTSLIDATPSFYRHFTNPASTIPEDKIISLTVQNSQGCSDVFSKTISVYPKVTASFNPIPNQVCYPSPVSLQNTTVNADYYVWNFGDGISSSTESPNHYYSNFSTVTDSIYSIRLITRSAYNCYDTAYDQVTIWPKPDVDFNFPVTVNCPPFTAEMVNSSSGQNLSYLWDFAGLGTDTMGNTSFEFSNLTASIIDYPIKLIGTSDKGCVDSTIKYLSVYPNVYIDSTSSSITEGCSPHTVNFFSDATNVQQMLWYIDDEAFSNLQNPSYRFINSTSNDTSFTVKYIATSIHNCIDSTKIDITVYPSPTTSFGVNPLPADYDTVLDYTDITFTNLTNNQSTWEYEWDYGDGTIDNQNAAQFTYTYGNRFWGDIENDNQIPVTLTAWNSLHSECTTNKTYNIIINPPLPQVEVYDDLAGCQPFSVDFSATTKYIYPDSYLWNFGVGNGESSQPNPSYTFTEPGTYFVTLTIDGDGGQNLDYKKITVYPKPTLDFEFNDTVVFLDEDELIFYNYSINATNVSWYFDATNMTAGVPDNNWEPKFTYSTPEFTPGKYHVALLGYSESNCSDTLIHPIGINVIDRGVLQFPNIFWADPAQIQEEFNSTQAIGNRNKYLFYPIHASIADYSLEIYNRWGQVIFKSDDVNRGWNGLINGEIAAQGVYVYRVSGHYKNGKPFAKSGDITLMRGNPPDNP